MNNYQKIIMDKIAAGEISSNSPGIIQIDCRHDPWCGINKGGECNCNVDVVQKIRPTDMPGKAGHKRHKSNN